MDAGQRGVSGVSTFGQRPERYKPARLGAEAGGRIGGTAEEESGQVGVSKEQQGGKGDWKGGLKFR